MKNSLSIALLIALLGIVFLGCQEKSSAADLANSPVSMPDSLFWMAETPGFDSLTGCDTFSSKTRYYSDFRIHFKVALPAYPNEGENESNLSVEFDMTVQLPGNRCKDSIPYSASIYDSNGENLTITLSELKYPAAEFANFSENFHVSIGIPKVDKVRLLKGGLCIILESIDPKSAFEPNLVDARNWKLVIDDEPLDLSAVQDQIPIEPPGFGTPVRPACSACLLE